MIQAYNGHDPFADARAVGKPPGRATYSRIAPDPSTLPVLTPEAFDAMFPGKRVRG